MERPSYLSKYMFDWELLNVVISGQSALDSEFFIAPLETNDEVNEFLKGYGLDPTDPISKAELFGNFQEALQFIRRYFLIEGNPDGLDLKIPNQIYMIAEINDLFLMATKDAEDSNVELRLWAEVILKVMHTILHVDKDLRSNYFNVIQTQIFDKFYKFLHRDENKKLFFGTNQNKFEIPLLDFVTKSKKTRDSVIIKLLHKPENVAEELFDRIGVRIVTETRFDTLRVIRFLLEHYIIVPHNIKPSRSTNTLIDLQCFKDKHKNLVKMAIRNELTEERFLQAANREVVECAIENSTNEKNVHTSNAYKTIQFTSRQLIKYKNPFLHEFNELRKEAKKADPDNALAKKLLSLDLSLVARDIRFFYPYEIQVVDKEGQKINSEGEASHLEYKRAQILSSMKRVFRPLMVYKNIRNI